jgi:hypothetical protein
MRRRFKSSAIYSCDQTKRMDANLLHYGIDRSEMSSSQSERAAIRRVETLLHCWRPSGMPPCGSDQGYDWFSVSFRDVPDTQVHALDAGHFADDTIVQYVGVRLSVLMGLLEIRRRECRIPISQFKERICHW